MKKVEAEEVAALVDETRGNIAVIARRLGVNRSTVWNRCKETPELMAALEDAREGMLDAAESKLYEAVLRGQTPELLFYLKTRGKSRGYVERQEVSGPDGGPIKHVNESDLDREIATLLAEHEHLAKAGDTGPAAGEAGVQVEPTHTDATAAQVRQPD